MNYAVMYEYAVDKSSSQFKAPFNEIKNGARVFTYKDTAIITPNSDTPYSFLWLDLRAEPMVLSVPAVEKSRYYVVQLEDGNTFNYGYIGSRAVPGRKPPQSLPDQFADAAGDEEESGRLADPLHPEGFAGQGEGVELAAGTQRPDLPGHAPVLAEDRGALYPTAGRGHVAAAGHRDGEVARLPAVAAKRADCGRSNKTQPSA
jgi:hypothetical protein